MAQTSEFNFNTTGQLSNNFNGSGTHVSNVVQATAGGLNDSGSVSVPSAVTNAVFVTKNSYSLGPVGSSYSFQTYIKSTGPNGYSGAGFTGDSPTSLSIPVLFIGQMMRWVYRFMGAGMNFITGLPIIPVFGALLTRMQSPQLK
ncbi:hypothetical protein [Algoriphagus boritolerans]|uniref:hypothetical protein n=1 Tax=Algoriphagus boritolerans TaxID=308111 RepID=UPI000AE19D27